MKDFNTELDDIITDWMEGALKLIEAADLPAICDEASDLTVHRTVSEMLALLGCEKPVERSIAQSSGDLPDIDLDFSIVAERLQSDLLQVLAELDNRCAPTEVSQATGLSDMELWELRAGQMTLPEHIDPPQLLQTLMILLREKVATIREQGLTLSPRPIL